MHAHAGDAQADATAYARGLSQDDVHYLEGMSRDLRFESEGNFGARSLGADDSRGFLREAVVSGPPAAEPALDGTIDLIVVESDVGRQQGGENGLGDQGVHSWHQQQVVKQRSWQQRQVLKQASSGEGVESLYIAM